MKKITLSILALLLAACSEKGGEYVGKWQNAKYENRSVVIERNGEAFIIKQVGPSMWKKGEIETMNIPAVFKDGMLQIQTGLGAANVSYVKSNDTLLMPTMAGSAEYKRIK